MNPVFPLLSPSLASFIYDRHTFAVPFDQMSFHMTADSLMVNIALLWHPIIQFILKEHGDKNTKQKTNQACEIDLCQKLNAA